MTLTKADLKAIISEQADVDKETANRSVEAMIEIIKSSLESGDELLISGFGKISVQEKKVRRGRNPATGEDLMLPARKRLLFKWSGKLKKQMNKEEG